MLPVAKLTDNAVLPTRAHEGDAGLDLYACEAAHIGPGERWGVGTGVAVEIPPATPAWWCRAPASPATTGSRWSTRRA